MKRSSLPPKAPRQRFGVLPSHTWMHGVRTETKLAALAVLAVTTTFDPSWITLAAYGAIVVVVLISIRVPPALLVPPRWLVAILALGGILSAASGEGPSVDVGPFAIGYEQLEPWARLVLFAVVLVLSALIAIWTTPLASLARAIHTLLWPVRLVGLQTIGLSTGLALSVRALPAIGHDLRHMMNAYRVQYARHDRPKKLIDRVSDLDDLLATAVVVSLRRSNDLADALATRGPWTPGPRDCYSWRDGLVVFGVAGVIAVAMLFV